MCNEETETHRYRRLWLDAAHELGQVAVALAEALDWPRCDGPNGRASDDVPLDALALADEAAQRIAELPRLITTTRHRQPRQPVRREREFA